MSESPRDRYVQLLLEKLAAMPGYDPELCDRIERALGSTMIAPALSPQRVQITRVIEVVASRYGVEPAALIGPTRKPPEVVTARHLAMRLSRELTGETFEAIGAVFHRNHATVMYACQQTESMAVGDIREELEAAWVSTS